MNKVWEEDINNLYSDFKEKEDRILFLQQELQRKDNIINELKENLIEVREKTFTKYHSNEWDNCLSWEEDIRPILDKIKELEERK